MSDTPDLPEAELQPKPKPATRLRPRRKWVKWLIRVVVLMVAAYLFQVGLALAERLWTRNQNEIALKQTVAEVEQTDPEWDWEHLQAVRKRLPAGKNSAELIPQIKSHMHKDWGKELKNEKWKPLLEIPSNVRYSPSVLAEVRGDLAASAEAVKLARMLKDFPNGRRDIVLLPDVLNTRLPELLHTRELADLLHWDIVIAIEDGDHSRAADNLLALLNLSRSLSDEEFLISQVLRMAVRIVTVRHLEQLLAHTADAPPLTEFQTALAADTEEPLLLYGLRGERAIISKLFQNLENGTATPQESLEWTMNSPWDRFAWWHYRGHLPADHAAYLKWMTTAIEYARLPIHEQPPAFGTLEFPTKDPKRLLSSLFTPAIDKVANAYWASCAEARCAVVGIACERFRQKYNRWPNELTELTPTFIPAVPLDPYDAEPLKYAKLNDGIAIHTVGQRLPPSPGLAPPKRWGLPEGTEFGFRLWNPEQRRLPPLPDPDPLPPEDEKQP